MTPKLTVRSFTNDQYVLDKVFYTNFYKLRGFKADENRPIVLDLGAHCGYFTFAALSLGAKKVYSFEPFTPNYKMLLLNVGDNPIGQVIPYQLGVYVAPICLTFNYPDVIHRSYFDFAKIGIDMNLDNPEFCRCCVLPLDTILEHYVGEQVDVMKISIGYTEIAILNTSEMLGSRVHNICGEIGLDDAGKDKLRAVLAAKGFGDTQFYPVEGEESKWLFLSSKTKLQEMFT